MIDDLFSADTEAAARDRIAKPQPPKPAETKFSAWQAITASARGITTGAAQIMASTAEMIGGYGQVLGAYPEAVGYSPTGGARKQADAARSKLLAEGVDLNNDVGDSLRAAGRSYAPDPVTAHWSEQLIYGFARGATKVVGGALAAGPAGVLAAGAEEGMSAADDLRTQGVDFRTRSAAGAVQGAGLALAALPAVGQTLKATAGLYAIGGPGGFIAQQALTREILQGAGYEQIGAQFDPFDPVGLAVATLLPAGFAAYGLRQQKIARAVASLPDLPPRAEAAPVEPAASIPSRETATAAAVRAYPAELVDAARVSLLAERRAAANPGAPDNLRAMDQHEAALARAEDQIARGEPVRVDEVAPQIAPRVAPTETPEFRAWFGDSKVVDDAGRPLVVYHGTAADVAGFDLGRLQAEGIHLSADPAVANTYASSRAMDGGRGANVMPVYVKADRVLDVPMVTTEAIRRAAADGFDAVRRGDHIVVMRPEQIKSAIGNSGRFDPNSASLTDGGFATWADQVNAAIRELKARTDATTRPQAPNPEAAAPARSAGDAATAADAADTGRAAASVEAAGLNAPDDLAAVSDALRPLAPSISDQIDALLRNRPQPEAPAGAADARRMEAIRAQFPDLQVMVDGMDKPMPMAEFLAAAKAEADDLAADAPLIQTAAECALLHGF